MTRKNYLENIDKANTQYGLSISTPKEDREFNDWMHQEEIDLYSDPNYNWFFEDVLGNDPDARHYYTPEEVKLIDKVYDSGIHPCENPEYEWLWSR